MAGEPQERFIHQLERVFHVALALHDHVGQIVQQQRVASAHEPLAELGLGQSQIALLVGLHSGILILQEVVGVLLLQAFQAGLQQGAIAALLGQLHHHFPRLRIARIQGNGAVQLFLGIGPLLARHVNGSQRQILPNGCVSLVLQCFERFHVDRVGFIGQQQQCCPHAHVARGADGLRAQHLDRPGFIALHKREHRAVKLGLGFRKAHIQRLHDVGLGHFGVIPAQREAAQRHQRIGVAPIFGESATQEGFIHGILPPQQIGLVEHPVAVVVASFVGIRHRRLAAGGFFRGWDSGKRPHMPAAHPRARIPDIAVADGEHPAFVAQIRLELVQFFFPILLFWQV